MAGNSQDEVRTVVRSSAFEIPRIKSSRFLAFGAHAADFGAAKEVLEEQRSTYNDARHHCFAWRGHGSDSFRVFDAGEPRGSAGMPMLKVIDGRGLSQVIVVVVRYFGGTKLGVGGLMRAYSQAAGAMLDRAEKESRPVMETLILDFSSERTGIVFRTLAARGLQTPTPDYSVPTRVQIQLEVPRAQRMNLQADLNDNTSGEIRYTHIR